MTEAQKFAETVKAYGYMSATFAFLRAINIQDDPYHIKKWAEENNLTWAINGIDRYVTFTYLKKK